jgi:hypothetical protein
MVHAPGVKIPGVRGFPAGTHGVPGYLCAVTTYGPYITGTPDTMGPGVSIHDYHAIPGHMLGRGVFI